MRDIIGHGGGKGGGDSHTHYEAPDSLHSTAYARVLDLVSEGEILGLAEGTQSIYMNGTPVANADGSTNFKNVTVDFRTGTQDQDYIAGFPDVENEVTVGVELKYGTPWVHAITNTSLSAIRVTLGVDQLYKADTTNGDVGGTKVDYQIELSTDGGAYQVKLANSFNGKTMSAYQRTARIDLPPATSGWQVRVTRLTANSSVVSIVDKTNIISYTEVIDAKLRYPMSAIVGVQIDATQFQSIPTRAYDLYGRIIQVPSNYDAINRTYAGTWDGTFKPSWSNNPAWVFRDLVLHDRYGLGNRITASQIDKWALYKIARYCDELVPDGKGGTEPRFTCNLYLQTRKQAYAVLQDIASIFRGISYWGAGSIIASADMPSDPVYIYTAANVGGGKFNRAGSKKSTRYTVALVTWNDPDDFYKQKVEYVEDREGIARYGIQQVELTAFGCTSQGQAQRAGRWALATSRLETEGITFDVGMDGAIALPGQVVRVADPARMGRRVGGRVHSASGRVVTLDKAPVINVGDQLTVVLPSGVSETHGVAAVSGESVTIDADWTALPVAQSAWSVDSNELMAPLYRVLSVAEKDELTFAITAVQHEPGKYDFVENGTAITPRVQTSLDVTRQAAPTSVTLVGYTVSLNDVQKLALQISCAPVPGAVAYEGAYRRGNDNWVAIPRQASPTMDVLDVLAGTYTAKMFAVNSIGVTSIETMSVAVDIERDGASKNATVLLNSDALQFHTTQEGVTDPLVINFSATLIALDGPVSWSCVGGTLSNLTDTTAQLAYADATGASAVVTASVTAFDRTYSQSMTIRKVQDGAAGTDGLQTAIARLYQWASTAPAKPIGTSTFTWASVSNGAYSGSDGWSVSVPTNPGTPGLSLFIASIGLSAAASATTTSVSYSSSSVDAWSQNGQNGAAGVQSATATVYQWATTIPAGPAGSAAYTWASGNFGAAPAGWEIVPSAAPSPGMTKWAAQVRIIDSAANSSTAFNWSTASIVAAGYAGNDGAAGASFVAAYCVTTTPTASGAPAPTTGKTSLPADNSAGLVGTWTATPPASVPAGSYLFQSTGTYNPATDLKTWDVPYWSYAKFASLSAITANMGQITAGSLDIGSGSTSWHVDSSGNQWAGASSYAAAPYRVDNAGNVVMKSVQIQDGAGNILLSSGGVGSIPTSIAAAANTAVWSSVAGTGKPADNASSDIVLVPRGSCAVSGNTAAKGGGTTAWDSDVYSVDSFTGGAFASAVAADTTGRVMFGLNDDPLSNSSYDTLNYAIYMDAGTLEIYESGGIAYTVGAYSAGDVFAVAYNGSCVQYFRNGNLIYTSGAASASTPNQRLYFDSSFYSVGAKLTNIRFGPLSSNNWQNVGGIGKPSDNASSDITLIGRGVTVTGNYAKKTNGSGAWGDADAYSVESFVGGAFASAKIAAGGLMMFGLNSDPAADESYVSLDFAMYTYSDGSLFPYVNGDNKSYPSNIGTWAVGDVLSVQYDGSKVYWLKGNTVLYTYTPPAQITTPLFFDSAFADNGAALSNIRFGPLSSNNWQNVGGTGKPADNATVGAPSGTYVGSTLAQTVESNAAAGKSANDAIPGINSAIADKLSKTSAGSLAATVTLATGGSILSGTTTNGTYQNPSGFYGVQGGVVKFSVPISGDPTFAGQLMAAYGSFGAVSIATGGSFSSGQTAYDTGTGWWWGYSGSTPVMSIGKAGGPGLLWDGTNLYINSPVLTALTAVFSGTLFTTVSNGTVGYGGLTVNTSGGTPQSYTWSVSWAPEGSISALYSISGGQGTNTAYFQGTATNNRLDATIVCTVTFTDGRTATAYRSHTVTHGTYNP